MKNTQRKTMKSYITLKQRITAAVTAVVMLAQIFIPTVALATTAWSGNFESRLASELNSPMIELINDQDAPEAYTGAYFIHKSTINHTTLNSFYESYTNDRTDLKPAQKPKFIGDSFVQTRLIRAQYRALTGRYFFSGVLRAEEVEANAINNLYVAAKGYAARNNLTLGSPLSNASSAPDMILPELKQINGKSYLVPVVHLTEKTITDNKWPGHLIEFDSNATFAGIQLDFATLITGYNSVVTGLRGIINNQSSIKSPGNLTLNGCDKTPKVSDPYSNSPLGNIHCSGTIANLGGTIDVEGTLNIYGKDFINKTLVVPYKDKNGEGTRLGRVANIEAGNIQIFADGNIEFIGASAVSEGTFFLNAANDINIVPLTTQGNSQSQEGHWKVNKSTTDLLMSRLAAEDTLSLIAGGVINITASELISTSGGIELLAGEGIHILDELEQTSIQKEDRKGKTKGTSSEFRTEAVRAILNAGKGVLLDSEHGDVVLRATQLTSTSGTEVYARNGKVHLLMTKELEEFHLQTTRKGTWTIKTRTEDIVHENNIQNAIVGGLQVQAMYGINVEYTGKEGASLKEQLEEYAKMPEMAWMAKLYNKCWVEKEGEGITVGSVSATDPNNSTNCDGPKVSWKQIEEVHEEIRKSKSNLSPAAMAIIAIAVCIAMGPAGAGLIGAGGIGGATVTATTIAGVTTVTTTVSLAGAIAQAAMLTLATQAAQSLAAGNNLRETISSFDSDENLRSLATSMATAGAMNYANVGNLKLFDVPTGAEYSFVSFANQAYNAVAGATINSAISVSINGGNSEAYREAFKQNLALQAVNTIGDAMTRKIGGLASGQNPQISEAMKYIALAGTGCIIGLASSSASSGSSNSTACYSGVGGSVIGEYVGELYSESKQREQKELIERYLLEKGIASETDFYNLDAMAYGQLVAQRPKFTHEEIFNMKLVGVDLAKLSAALTAFVAGADINIAADAGERASRYSAFYNFDAAMDAVAAIDQFMKLDKVVQMLNELEYAIGDKTKITEIIQKYIVSGDFEFLKGLSVADALEALIKYVQVNGDSAKLSGQLQAILWSIPEFRVRLTAESFKHGMAAGVEDIRDKLKRAMEYEDSIDPRVKIESDKLFAAMLAADFDPKDNQYVAQLNALIELAPPENRDLLRYQVGLTLGVTQFLVNTGADVGGVIQFAGYTTIGLLDHVLYSVTGDLDFRSGSNMFVSGLSQFVNALDNVESIPADMRAHYKNEIERATGKISAGDYFEAGKIRSTASLNLLFAALGAGAGLKVFSNLVARQGENANFGGLASEVDNVRGNTDRTNDEFIGHPDLLPEHVWVSKTEFRQHILENLIPLKDGMTPDQLYDLVLSKPKDQRPLPETYLSTEYISQHLAKFDNGVVRFQRSAPASGKSIGVAETWVLPQDLALNLVNQSQGSVRALETLLGLKSGTLGDSPVIVNIVNPSNLRISTGREYGANELWVPGGYTANGSIPEVVIDPVLPSNYTTSSVF